MTLRKAINNANHKRQLIQNKLRNGNINGIQKIQLIFVEIKVDEKDLHKVIEKLRETQSGNKYFGVSLEDIRVTVNTTEKYILK